MMKRIHCVLTILITVLMVAGVFLMVPAAEASRLFNSDTQPLTHVPLRLDPAPALPVAHIVIDNAYARNKHSGDVGRYFAVLPDQALEHYLAQGIEAEQGPSAAGRDLTRVIERASVFLRSEHSDSQDRIVYAVEFKVRASLTKEGVTERESLITMNRNLLQLPDIRTRAQLREEQLRFMSRTLQAFDQKFRHTLNRELFGP